jgi:hypothetical protein
VRISSRSERPVRDRPRRLADWLNPAGDKKVYSLEDPVSKRKGLAVAWLRSANLKLRHPRMEPRPHPQTLHPVRTGVCAPDLSESFV